MLVKQKLDLVLICEDHLCIKRIALMTYCRHFLSARKNDFMGMFFAGLFLVFISRDAEDAVYFVPTGLAMGGVGLLLLVASVFFGKVK